MTTTFMWREVHPALSVFLSLIWNKERVRLFLFRGVVFYVMFILFLSLYILYSEYVGTASHRGVAINTSGPLSLNDNDMTSGMKDATWYKTSQVLWYILMILLGLLFMRWMVQLLIYRRSHIQSQKNWLQLLLIIVTFTSSSGIVDSIEVNRHLFAIAILLGWFELVLLLGRLPQLSVQMEMLKTVRLTFLIFMAGYFVLILAVD